MGLLAFPFLLLLHFVYSLINLARSTWRLLVKQPPLPLLATRRKIPKHICILFVPDIDIDLRTTELCLLESVENAIGWCRALGIERLSIYDHEGILHKNARIIQEYFGTRQETSAAEPKQAKLVDMVYPPTPPASEPGSRPLSPELDINIQEPCISFAVSNLETTESTSSRRLSSKPPPQLTLYVVSQESSKTAISSVASSLAQQEVRKAKIYPDASDSFYLSVNQLESVIEGKNGFPAPDFMIVHPLHPSKYNRSPLELHGFPPWQMRLTEFYHNRKQRYYRSRLMWFLPSHVRSSLLASTLSETEFREALDSFAGVDMRFGK